MIIEYCATRLIPKIKIDFCPNKYRLILLSCPLQLISIDSRSPSGLRLTKLQNGDQDVKFQFTQPKRAATVRRLIRYRGCIRFNSRSPSRLRLTQSVWVNYTRRFNSRSPSGLRHGQVAYGQVRAEVQFTQPKRAATGRNREELADLMFQFTQPKRAATVILGICSSQTMFQFTQPKRAATFAHR